MAFALGAFRIRRDLFHEELVWKSAIGLAVLLGCGFVAAGVSALLAKGLRSLVKRAPFERLIDAREADFDPLLVGDATPYAHLAEGAMRVEVRDGVVRVRTEVRDCVVFFCKTMVLVQDVTVTANEVLAEVVPEAGDFRHGFLRWSIDSAGNGVSRIVFEALMAPDFFVPPIIGGFLVRGALRKQVLATAENLVDEAPREPQAGDDER